MMDYTAYLNFTAPTNTTGDGKSNSSPSGYILQLLVVAFLLTGNILVLLTLRHWTLVHTGTKYLFAYVAIAHILFGLTSILRALVFFANIESFLFCVGNNALVVISVFSSMTATVFLSMETLLALTFPVKFRILINLKNEMIMIALSAVFWIIFGSLSFPFSADPDTIDPGSGCHLCSGHYSHGFVQAICLFLFAHIFIIAILQVTVAVSLWRRFGKQAKQEGCSSSGTQEEDAEGVSKKQRVDNLKKIQALSRTVTVMGVFYTLGWGPLMVNAFTASLCYPDFCEPFQTLTPLLSVPALINCSINIVTYVASNRHFRLALFKLLRCHRFLSQVQPEVSLSSN